MRTLIVLLTLCLLVSTSSAADHVVLSGETWQDIASITENQIEALQVMNPGVNEPQSGQSIRYISEGELDELRYMFVYESGGLRSPGLFWVEIIPRGSGYETRSRQLEPWDHLTLDIASDAQLWCQKMLRELTETDADYPYYCQSLDLLEKDRIWQRKPPVPSDFIVYHEVYTLAEHWRTWARE